MTDTPLLLAGSISETYLNKLCAMQEFKTAEYLGMLSPSGVKSIINESFLGSAVTLDVGQYYSACNLATKTTEYMMSGIPVLINKTTYNLDLLNQVSFGKAIRAENLDEYAEAINFYKNNPLIAQRDGNAGRDFALQHFTWELEAKKLLALYASIFNKE